jgi:hypothetical protein
MHGLVIQHGDEKQICQGIFEFDRRLGPLRRKDAQTDRAVRFFCSCVGIKEAERSGDKGAFTAAI